MQVYILKKHAKRLRAGYPWVFKRHLVPLGNLAQIKRGQWVEVCDESGKRIGCGTCDMESEIVIRIMSWEQTSPDRWLRQSLNKALKLRESFFPGGYYRWVYGESDQLGGLVVDRFGDYVSVQISTQGMWQLKTQICQIIQELTACCGIIIRTDSRQARIEGLMPVLLQEGEIPEYVMVKEDDRTYYTRLIGAQKSGWYYDQRANHTHLQKLIKSGQQVLDLFCYQGGFSLGCALEGARITLVDQSSEALQMAQYTFSQHELSAEFVCADVFDFIAEERREFDVVVIDPPALITDRAHFVNGQKAYQMLIHEGVRCTQEQGLLVFASCSSHVTLDHLKTWLQIGLKQAGRNGTCIYQAGHDKDHLPHPKIPATNYLKCLIYRLN